MQDEILRIWEGTGKTILFVTHGIDQSLYLADRNFVLTAGPAEMKRVITVPLPRPRDRTAVVFAALYREIQDLLKDEVMKTLEREGVGR